MLTQKYIIGESDNAKRKLRLEEYYAPRGIRLVDTLEWAPSESTKGPWLSWEPLPDLHLVKPLQETFEMFVALTEASDREILTYANKWGVLGLCREHLWPVGDNLHPQCAKVCEAEPISAWRKWSRIARALFEISQSLDDGVEPELRLWESLLADGWVEGRRMKMERQKRIVASSINRWLEMGQVHPVLVWDAGEPRVSLGPAGPWSGGHRGGLFGALGIGLLENAGRYLIATCSGCRKFYNPEIRPKSGQDRYCQKCRDAGVPVARAKHRKALGISKPRTPKARKARKK